MQAAAEIRQHRAGQQAAQQFPDRIAALGPQQVTEPPGRQAVGSAQFIAIGGEKAAALEKRAVLLSNQPGRAGHDRVEEHAAPALAVKVGIPPVAQRGKMGREPRLVASNRFLIALRQRDVLPIGPEIRIHPPAHRNQVGLDVLRHHAVFAAEPPAAHCVMPAQPPEIKVLALHRRKKAGQRAYRPGQRIIHEHDFVVSFKPFTADCLQRSLVRADVEAGVLPLEQGQAGPGFGPGTAFGVELAVCHKQNGLCRLLHGLHGKTAGRISLPARVVMEVDHKPDSHNCLV